jgi:hypothetical protein
MTLVRIDVSEEHSVSIIRVTRIVELGTTLTVASNRSKLRRNLMMEALRSSETSVLIKAIRHNIHRRGNLKSYIFLPSLTFMSYISVY